MAGVLFSGACEKCKERHVKCGGERPSCSRCTNIGVTCPGYVKRSVFVDERASIERRARRRKAVASDGSLKDSASVSHAYNKPGVDVRYDLGQSKAKDYRYLDDVILVPELASTYHFGGQMDLQNPISSSFDMPTRFDADGSDMSTAMTGTEFLGGPSTNQMSDHGLHPTSKLVNGPGSEHFPDASSAQSTPVLRSESHGDTASTPPLLSASNFIEQSSFFAEFAIESEHEMAFLVRHFSEVISPWFDLFDSNAYFGRYVPLRVHDSLLLRYATAAIAAKQLGRVQGRKASQVNVTGRPAMTETYPGAEYVDWHYKAANYYHKALSYLRTSLQNKQTWDEFLGGALILSVYEFLDGSRDEFAQHLIGVKSLLDQVVRSDSPIPNTLHAAKSQPSQAARAAFWVFVREDYVKAYVDYKHTYLDTEDVSMWRFFGLRISDAKAEDDFGNHLMWIICKIVNFLSGGGQKKTTQGQQSEMTDLGETEHNQKRTAKRADLSKELESWMHALPQTFTPCARIDNPRNSYMGAQLPIMPFPELYFSITACAASIQFYHFARIILLLDELQDDSRDQASTSNRLRHYREVSRKINSHCREICAIAVGRPPGSVRMHMPQPLFLAGQCLEDLEERKCVVELLREIERDTGWATEYRAKQLQAEYE